MTSAAWLQLLVVILAVAVVAPLLGRYLAEVHGGGSAPGDRIFLPIERAIYRVCGVDPAGRQRWPAYALSVLAFGAVSVLGLFVVLRLQSELPFNPTGVDGMPAALAFNVAVSFVTGTNWQSYAGESTISHLSQMSGLVVAQFTAAAVGMSVALAVVRGVTARRRADDDASDLPLGSFWVDATRNIVRILIPLAAAATVVMISQGVMQNLHGNRTVEAVAGGTQTLPGGPVATQEVLKYLGTNGGGFYNAGSAHPLANPNGVTSVFEFPGWLRSRSPFRSCTDVSIG